MPVCDRLGEHPRDQRGPLTGPNPTDRGKKGSKIHLTCDRNGLPISLGISAANTDGFEAEASAPGSHAAGGQWSVTTRPRLEARGAVRSPRRPLGRR